MERTHSGRKMAVAGFETWRRRTGNPSRARGLLRRMGACTDRHTLAYSAPCRFHGTRFATRP